MSDKIDDISAYEQMLMRVEAGDIFLGNVPIKYRTLEMCLAYANAVDVNVDKWLFYHSPSTHHDALRAVLTLQGYIIEGTQVIGKS
jgi:hypothetical protein